MPYVRNEQAILDNAMPPSLIVKLHIENITRGKNRIVASQRGDPRTALDVGCGRGRNSFYLAEHGLKVTGLDISPSILEEAQRRKVTLGIARESCKFVEADMRSLPEFKDKFNMVAANEVLHYLPKDGQYHLLEELRARTKLGGAHMVSGYVLSKEVQDPKNLARLLEPGELADDYERAGWRVDFYRDTLPDIQEVDGQERVLTLANIIARRPFSSTLSE